MPDPIDRPTLVAAIREAISELSGGQRAALEHHGWIEPDQVLRGWSGGALVDQLRPGPLTEPGLIAVGLRRALELGPPAERSSITEPAIIAGDLSAAGDLRITAPVLVLGDLVAAGVIRDCGPDSLVVVAGDCRCRGLAASGELLVLGDLEAEVVRGIYNDNSLLVGGALRARFVDSDDHDISPYGPVEVEHFFELGRSEREAAAAASAFLIDQAVDTELRELDWPAIFDRLSSGAALFRAEPREPVEPEPDEPTEAELAGIDVDAVIAASKRRLSRSTLAYADNQTGELWFVDRGAGRVTIHRDGEHWSSKTGGRPGADRQGRPADRRVTLWRERGDLFVDIEQFGDDAFVHVGWNNGRMETFPRPAAEIETLRRAWSRGFVEVVDAVPGRGVLERELGHYEGGQSRYLSLCIRDNALETSAGERRRHDSLEAARADLERELAERRAAGWILKILEWRPFGRMG